MWGASCAPAVLLLLAAIAVVAENINADAASAESIDATVDTINGTVEPLEDEVESAPFAIVVEHDDEWRCGGALVTLRVALSTATCARGRRLAPPADLWARAPGATAAVGARRITRVAVAIDSQGLTDSEKWTEEAWIGVVLDMALLELEAPFAAAAGARPILMAERDECDPQPGSPAPACLVVRTPAHAIAPLRIGNAGRASPRTCADVAPHWAAVADKAICLSGPHFCQSDWGAGVVCNGKLCGVLSRSARSSGEGTAAAEAGCGDTHAAQHLPRWNDFVNCAQTKDRCGRDDCAAVCSERMLPEASAEKTREGAVGGAGGGGEGAGGGGRGDGGGSTKGRSRQPAGPDDYGEGETKVLVATSSTEPTPSDSEEGWPGVDPRWRAGTGAQADTMPTRTPPQRLPPIPSSPPLPPPQPLPMHTGDSIKTVRMAQSEFEPYRADFKSGEYDDNGASYDSAEESVRLASSRESPGKQDSVPAALVGQFEPASTKSPATSRPPTTPSVPSPPPPPLLGAQLAMLTKPTKQETKGVGRLSATPFVICLRHIFVMYVFVRVF